MCISLYLYNIPHIHHRPCSDWCGTASAGTLAKANRLLYRDLFPNDLMPIKEGNW